MKVYLAGFKTIEKHYLDPTEGIYLLSSFWEHKGGNYGEYVSQNRHILDSGAFSALADKTGKYKTFDWDGYVKKYIVFIKQTGQKLFFELDLDSVIGLPRVEYYRSQIEDAVGLATIPVWHKSRGLDYWHKMISEYNYVAIGGIVTKAIQPAEHAVFTPLLRLAKENNCKVHGLGFTSVQGLHKYPFYSVDSTTWNVGGKFGNVCCFAQDWGSARQMKPKGRIRVKSAATLHLHNFAEWVKFQQYADANL